MPRKDYSGQIIRGIKLNRRIEDYLPPSGGSGLARYNCTCMLCNSNIDIPLYVIKRKDKVFDGCGCEYKNAFIPRPNNRHDITNQRFGWCIAKERLEDGRWKCLCDCGKYFIISISHLTTGHTKSCGCYRNACSHERNFIDLTGRKYNMLTVLKFVYTKEYPSGGKQTFWLCRCDCGMLTIVSTSALTSTKATKSCGCLGASKRELEIRDYLKSNNIKATTEYKFEDLKLKGYLRYDFAIFDGSDNLLALIEHYGIQHFSDNSTIDFGKQQREVTDKIKQDYCELHSIKLFIITYKDDLHKKLDEIFAELHVNTVPSTQELA